MSPSAFAAVAALLGAVVGSFLNVVIHRLPRGESIVRPGSRCTSCGRAIRPFDNVPVLAWLWLRGRCRHCGARISARYPLVEALTAALFAALAWRFGPTPPANPPGSASESPSAPTPVSIDDKWGLEAARLLQSTGVREGYAQYREHEGRHVAEQDIAGGANEKANQNSDAQTRFPMPGPSAAHQRPD